MKIVFKHEIKKTDNLKPTDLVNLILKHRSIKNVKEFLNSPSPQSISLTDFDKKYSLYLIKVVKLLKEIKRKNQMIVVYTDYDADGITGGAILWETLHILGFKVMPYVPDRKKEGYGFSIAGIDNVIKQFNPALIISVDHGITKVKEIEYAKEKGIKIIVTDHHLKSDEIPKADAIFHIPSLSGSGVAYFFAKEIHLLMKESSQAMQTKLQKNFQTDYLALASIGTIADLVPLTGPSRSVVKYGLEVFPKVNRFGIKHLLKQAAILGKKITPYEVGFIIAPRINAIGRLHHAIDALRLLCTTDEKKAYNLAQTIGKTNTERQDLVVKSVEEAKLKIKNQKSNIQKIIILESDKWHEGIIGLIASKITEEFYRPTIILTKTNGHYKGSARSIPSFHITNFLKSLKKYLVDVGGHAQAAGFTIEDKKLPGFKKEAEKQVNKLINEEDLERIITADVKIPVSKINQELVKSLETLEPFGIGNPRPSFLSETIVENAQLFGKQNNHLKMIVEKFELIAFNKAELFKTLSRDKKVDIVYTLEIDNWGGKEKLRGKLIYLEDS